MNVFKFWSKVSNTYIYESIGCIVVTDGWARQYIGKFYLLQVIGKTLKSNKLYISIYYSKMYKNCLIEMNVWRKTVSQARDTHKWKCIISIRFRLQVVFEYCCNWGSSKKFSEVSWTFISQFVCSQESDPLPPILQPSALPTVYRLS